MTAEQYPVLRSWQETSTTFSLRPVYKQTSQQGMLLELLSRNNVESCARKYVLAH